MIQAIYVTEPEVIDLDQVKSKLSNEDIRIIPGTVTFDDSKQYPYDTIIIRSETKVTDQIKSFFPELKNVVRIGTGLDNVDLDFCKREGIRVYNAAGANADAVSEYVVGVILYVTRRLHLLSTQDLVDWNRFKFTGTSMSDQTIGLIGFGNIGKLLHKKLSGFSCKGFLVYDPYINPADAPAGVTIVESIAELLQKSTIVSLHLPLTEETKNVINKEMLQRLLPNAILINASRGGIVDESAVLELLKDSAQFTYIADTIIDEPHGNQELFNHEHIIITPHIASLTDAAERQMITTALDNLLNGQ